MAQTFGTSAQPVHDIYLNSSGNIAILSGQAAVVAACQTASLLSLGEAVLATTTGIPFFQAVFVGTPNLAVFESYLRTALLNVQGVQGIKSLTINVSQSVLSYSAVIQSQYGEAEVLGSVPI